MNGFALMTHVLAVTGSAEALGELRLHYRVADPSGRGSRSQTRSRTRSPTGCAADVAFALQRVAPDSLSVAEIRRRLGMRWSGRYVNAILQKMVRRGDVTVTELGNPKRYAWNP